MATSRRQSKTDPSTMMRTSKRQKMSSMTAVTAVVGLALPSCQSMTLSPHFSTPPVVTTTPKEVLVPALLTKTPRTSSFSAAWAGSIPSLVSDEIQIHTLILGTHPSITSLQENQYYGHPMNAFWWIAGDCLGFRRASGISKKGIPYKFTSDLRHDSIIPYPQQLELLCSKGFALWDVVKQCERKGSLDQDIKKEVANDIEGFCECHPSIRRIVLANGGTGSHMFLKHFKDWWLSGALQPGENDESIKAFGKMDKKVASRLDRPISCISAISVSPAAAAYSFKVKRDFWEEHVFEPGLKIHRELKQLKQKAADFPHGV